MLFIILISLLSCQITSCSSPANSNIVSRSNTPTTHINISEGSSANASRSNSPTNSRLNSALIKKNGSLENTMSYTNPRTISGSLSTSDQNQITSNNSSNDQETYDPNRKKLIIFIGCSAIVATATGMIVLVQHCY